MQPSPLAIVGLIAAIEERYFDSEMATAWALAQLETCAPAGWLSDLAGCGGLNDALRALWDGYYALNVHAERIDQVSLQLGFGFLAYERGDRDLVTLLRESGELADSAGNADPECESFYLLLNEIDGGGPTMPGPAPLVARVEELYAPHARLARAAEKALQLPMAQHSHFNCCIRLTLPSRGDDAAYVFHYEPRSVAPNMTEAELEDTIAKILLELGDAPGDLVFSVEAVLGADELGGVTAEQSPTFVLMRRRFDLIHAHFARRGLAAGRATFNIL